MPLSIAPTIDDVNDNDECVVQFLECQVSEVT